MLHSELQNISAHLNDLVKADYPMTAAGLAHLADVLDDLAARVFILETKPVPFSGRLVDLPDGSNVVAFKAEEPTAKEAPESPEGTA